MNDEEILYNKIYEQTKDFGRTHFIKEIMNLQRKNAELQELYNNMFECHCNRVQVEKIQNNWNELKKWIDEYDKDKYDYDDSFHAEDLRKKMQELEQGKDE